MGDGPDQRNRSEKGQHMASKQSVVVQLYRRLTVPAADPRWNARLAGRLRLAA